MSNVLSDEKRQQIVALGRLGWSLRQIEEATGVRRETAGNYLKAAGIEVRAPGRWGHRRSAKAAIEAKPAIEVITDSEPEKPGFEADPEASEAALGMIDSRSGCRKSASACEPYREIIEQALDRGRNAMAIWQDLVSEYEFASGYQSVKRFANKIRPSEGLQPRAVIITAPGEDYGEFRVMLTEMVPDCCFGH